MGRIVCVVLNYVLTPFIPLGIIAAMQYASQIHALF
jgi:hypothetical protein